MNMPFKTLKLYNQSQVHQILKRLYWILNYTTTSITNNTSSSNKNTILLNNHQQAKEEFTRKFEMLRLSIAYRWLQTDSLDKKITAWKEFKEYIDTCKRKIDMQQNPSKYTAQQLQSKNLCKDQKSLPIFYITQKELLHFLYENNVLRIFLAEDVHEDLLQRSADVMQFLAWFGYLDPKYIDLLWLHTSGRQESFIQAVNKVLIHILPVLDWTLVEYVFQKIIDISMLKYDMYVISLISHFCSKILYRAQPQFMSSNGSIPQKISEWHCGLKLLWRAMQSERLEEEKHIPIVIDTRIQQSAMNELVRCLQTIEGSVHQEYIKNLCIENLRCSISVGTSLQVLQHIIKVHPEISPKESVVIVVDVDGDDDDRNDNCSDDGSARMDDDLKTENENKDNHEFTRESTRREIIHALENQHRILHLIFQDLARYMDLNGSGSTSFVTSSPSPFDGEEKVNSDDGPVSSGSLMSGCSSIPPPIPLRNIAHFKYRFDFLLFLLNNSDLQLSRKQLQSLWNIVICDSCSSVVDGSGSEDDSPRLQHYQNTHVLYDFRLERDHFFKWLKNICPIISGNMDICHALSIDDAVNLFHTKLGSMPKKNLTTNCFVACAINTQIKHTQNKTYTK